MRPSLPPFHKEYIGIGAIWLFVTSLLLACPTITHQYMFNGGAIISTLETLHTHACDGDHVRITCPPGSLISTQYAKYGRSVPSSAMCPPPPGRTSFRELIMPSSFATAEDTNCIAVRSLSVVSDLCEDRPSCSVLASPETFTQDPCLGTSKYLEVHYKCSPSEFEELTVCEGDEMDIDCHRGNRIAIFAAMFGRRPNGTAQCPPYKQGYIDCQASDTISEVRNQCHSRKKCSLLANASVFGDPCAAGINKYLTVSYACLPKKYLKQLHRKSGRRKKKKKRKRKKKRKKKRKGLDKLLPPDVFSTTTRDIPEPPFDNFYETFEKESVTRTDIARTTTEETPTVNPVPNNSNNNNFDTSPVSTEEETFAAATSTPKNDHFSPSTESIPSTFLVTTPHQNPDQLSDDGVTESENIATDYDDSSEDISHQHISSTSPTVVDLDLESGTRETLPDGLQPVTTSGSGPNNGREKEVEKEGDKNEGSLVDDGILDTTPDSVYDVLSSQRHNANNKNDSITTSQTTATPHQPTTEEDTSTVGVKSRTSDVKNNDDDDLRGVNLESDRTLGGASSENENSEGNSIDNTAGNRGHNINNNNNVRVTTSPPERIEDGSNPAVVNLSRPKGGDRRNSKSNVHSQDDKKNSNDKGNTNGNSKHPPNLVVERNLTVLCPNNSQIPTDIRWRRRERPRDVRTIGFLEDWFSTWHFLETHEEKAWLYFTLGICFGIIVLLIIILVKVCISFKRNIRARLDVSEPTHRSAQINNHSSLDAPMLEHSDSIDRIEFVQFHPRGTLRSMRSSNSHNRDIVNYYG